MKYTSTLIAIPFLLISSTAIAQDKKEKVDKNHANHYKTVVVENEHVSIEMKDVWARVEIMKVRAKITNKTNHFITVKPREFEVVVNGRTYHSKVKDMLIPPNETDGKTIEISGVAEDLHVDHFTLRPAGFAIISTDVPNVVAPDFQLPASTNVINAGNFEINLKKLKQETQETVARFEITYKGNGIGIIDPSRISVKTDSGQEFANAIRRSKLTVLHKGDTETISVEVNIPAKIVDMQFATLQVLFTKALKECEEVPFDFGNSASFVVDPGLTQGKN